ncbi:serine/threonine-protein kinase haspin-like isoform X2 [Dermacentor albipictus]|uniref:serine/threonine-protein kinase haspin-like isoform X2 n=1 Tax=Dermacentor albipictus TaxID=60249 RepID=UPI0031FD31D6
MLLGLAVVAAAFLFLLKHVSWTVVKSTRLLLGHCFHCLIECTAMDLISQGSEHLSANIDEAFASLLAACGQQSFATFDQLFSHIVLKEEGKFEKIAEGKNSEVFRIQTYTGDSVLKVVKLGYTQESQHRLLTEMKIASRLTALRDRLDFFTKGFVELKSVTCVFDKCPAELLEARERAARTLHDERRDGNESARTPRAYLVWHMSYGGVPLDKIELKRPLNLWSILHQVAMSLAVAEEALQFEHRALLLRRVLVKYTLEYASRYTIRGRDYVIETWFLEACILGGASARLSDGDTPVFTVIKHDSHEPMERHLLNVDINMKIVIRNDWRAFHPLTNRLWLRYLTKELRWLYKYRFGSDMNEFETPFWWDIGSWKKKLFKYSSLAEFVANLPHVRAQRRHGGLTTTTG